MPTLLMIALDAAVPLWMLEVADWSWERRQAEAQRCSQVIAEKGDVLQFGGKGCAEAFNATALGLAIGAYAPGGITFNGRHWIQE